MKKFSFSLARVLDWRNSQVHIEESKLERLYAELRANESKLREVQAAGEESGRALISAGFATGAELTALDNFRKAAAAECARLTDSAIATRRLIDAQLKVVLQKRRDVKLLEHLRSRQHDAWTAELSRHQDREASELHLLRSRSR